MRVAAANEGFVDRYPGEACIGGSFGPAAEWDWHRQYSDFIHVSMYMNSAAGLHSRPSRVRLHINYAALHSQGVKLHTPVVPTDDDSDSDVSVMSESSMAGANQQVGVASAEVETLMALSEEQLDEALRHAQLEGAEFVKHWKAQELLDVRKINEDLRHTRLVDPVPAPVQRQAAPTHRTSVSGLHARFEPQPTLRDLKFLDQEAERLVRGQVGTRYGLRDDVYRPVAEDFERPAGKRGGKSGLRQVLSENRTFFPQLCLQEYLRFEHVRDPIKFDDLDLRLFTAGELNIIDRPDISHIEMRGRLDLGRPVDTADNRAWFCRAYQRGECSQPDPHQAFVPGRGPVTVQHICAKCYLTDKKKLSHPQNSESFLVPQAGHHDKLRSSPHLCTVVSQRSLSLVTPSLWCRRKKNWCSTWYRLTRLYVFRGNQISRAVAYLCQTASTLNTWKRS